VGRPWDADLPIVTPKPGEPKCFTLVMPFYQNPQFLRQHLSWWATFQEDVLQWMTAIIVDDGSPQPAADAIKGLSLPMTTGLFRIEQDVRWNWLAARNVGMHHARRGWCLLTDIDHVVPESTARALIYGQHDPSVIYGFSRIEHTGEKLAAHPNSWFMTREMFWRIGGYDETLSGHYGTDGDWRRRCAAVAPIQILSDRLIRHEYQGDSSTTRYKRKQPEDAAVKGLIAARRPGWTPKTLSFPYHQVAL
jgi:hypothetical protein